jgi:glycosyltransferase involved in cell wall biosynthesis
VIWHGFDPIEFPESSYKYNILTLGLNMHRPWYNGYFVREKVRKALDGIAEFNLVKPDEPRFSFVEEGNVYARIKFRNYVDSIRQYSIYFNPTLRSPMPRSRGEAIICGLVSVSMKNHDVDMFIKNEINGFYSDNLEELAGYLKFLVQNPEKTKQIGKESRKLGIDIFNYDSYLSNWNQLINELT